MKKVPLLEVTRDDLGCEEPAVDGELAMGGIRYRILQVKARKCQSWIWQRRNLRDQPERWQLLVERLEELGGLSIQ